MSDFSEASTQEQVQRMQQAGRAALDSWAIRVDALKLIKYRENAVFELRSQSQRWALRVHRYGYHSDAALRSELQWMQALAVAGIPTPKVVPTRSGDLFVRVEHPGLPGPVQVDLFAWIDGDQLGSVESGITDQGRVDEVYQTIGSIAAKVHNQSANWSLPDGFTRHAWDAEGLAGEQPFWGKFWQLAAASAGQRELLVRVRDRLFEELTALARPSDSYSMIHADFAPENLLVNEGSVRVIDFDDAGFGWHLFELATSLYFIMDEPYFEQAKSSLVRGYRKHRPICDRQLALLPMFLTARGTTYLGWVHTRQGTATARELTPMLLEQGCRLAESYLQS